MIRQSFSVTSLRSMAKLFGERITLWLASHTIRRRAGRRGSSLEKRYQVFVSSTYRDLVDERQQVIQSLLMLNCFPCGMEYFPAGDDEVWEAIKKLIDACDYYIVIVAGKYGTVDKASGQSFTEKEYRYALDRNKRIAAFLHSDLDSIPSGKTETKPSNLKKLKEFRKLCGKKMCSEWTSAGDLKTKVLASMVHLMHEYPATGWARRVLCRMSRQRKRSCDYEMKSMN